MSLDGNIKPKRGRRTKLEINAAKLEAQEKLLATDKKGSDKDSSNIEFNIYPNDENTSENVEEDINSIITEEINTKNSIVVKNNAKKRGRKPKGGKIIQQTMPIVSEKEIKPNIILHLKCSIKDLTSSGDHNSNFTNANVDPYNFESSNDLTYEVITNPNFINNKMYAITDLNSINENNNEMELVDNNDEHTSSVEIREIWRKLKILEKDLHINNISDKKSACFWCTHDFDNPPIYIPKHFIKDTYNVYGCFCTPECAVAHLMEENLDSSTKFERYNLINHIYSKIYEYNKNIKPAPDPHYMLDKYYGNLTIQEYRSLLKSDRLFLIVDKPLTRILPEFHEDNDEFIINNKIIPSNKYQVKKRMNKKQPQTKSTILNEKFGIQNSNC